MVHECAYVHPSALCGTESTRGGVLGILEKALYGARKQRAGNNIVQRCITRQWKIWQPNEGLLFPHYIRGAIPRRTLFSTWIFQRICQGFAHLARVSCNKAFYQFGAYILTGLFDCNISTEFVRVFCRHRIRLIHFECEFFSVDSKHIFFQKKSMATVSQNFQLRYS